MKEKVVNNVMVRINNNYDFDDIKLEEIKYGLYGIYSLVTKISVVIIISYILNFGNNFLLFLLFYCLLRCFGFGTHAKTNFQCWCFTTILLISFPYIFLKLNINLFEKNILWSIFFINLIIFCPADTEKRPMINKKRKIIFKLIIFNICIIYLFLINKFSNISSIVLSSMALESLLVNPLGYILMGQKIRFNLNDIYLFKQKKEGGK